MKARMILEAVNSSHRQLDLINDLPILLFCEQFYTDMKRYALSAVQTCACSPAPLIRVWQISRILNTDFLPLKC